MRERSNTSRLLAAPLVTGLLLAACGSDDDADEGDGETVLTMTDAWSREPAEGQSRTAVYGVLANPGDDDVTVVAASSSVTDDVELHEVIDDDGVMRMQEREEGFVVPAGGEFVFEPGGPHVMMLDVDPATYPDPVDVVLTFDGAADLAFTAEIREIDGGMDMDSGEMDHGDMDDMDDGEMDDGEMDDEG